MIRRLDRAATYAVLSFVVLVFAGVAEWAGLRHHVHGGGAVFLDLLFGAISGSFGWLAIKRWSQ